MAERLSQSIVANMKHMRFVEKRTLQEIADEFGVSRQRVYQIVGKSGWIADYYERYRVRDQQKDLTPAQQVVEELRGEM